MQVTNNILFSYGRTIALYRDGKLILDEKYYAHSNTTSKHLTLFCEMNSKERAKGIKSGEILLDNLN
jgi:hypothetical protein